MLAADAVGADERAADRNGAARQGRAGARAAVDDVAVDEICFGAIHAAAAVVGLVEGCCGGRGTVADGKALDQNL